MKKMLLLLSFTSILTIGYSQKPEKSTKEVMLSEFSTSACKCVDSVNSYNKTKKEVSAEISKCISKQVTAYQMGVKLLGLEDMKDTGKEVNGKKQINISINMNEDSREFKEYYYELERDMMTSCNSLKVRLASNDKPGEKSFSDNKDARDYYTKGQDALRSENFEKAAGLFEQAVAADPNFAFAWDNLGLSYRRLNKYDQAEQAYLKSLALDPKGITPLQNLAVVYQYKKEYQKAIDTYLKLAEIDNNNPEVYYGLGMVYVQFNANLEKGLENMCKAYNLYIEQKSPFRTDAEKMIQAIYQDMKKAGKADKFNEILKANHITPN